MKKFVILFFAICALTLSICALSYAGEVSVLLDKLVEKGVLTPNEAKIVEQETKTQVSKEVVEKNSYALPDWVQNMKLSGDFRLRYQYERNKNDADARERGRVRYRLGIEDQVNSQVKVAARISSGSTDPRSTNQTFEKTFSRGDIRLDQAYVEYQPVIWGKTAGGVLNKTAYLWQPDNMLFDDDINPMGGSLHLEHALAGNMSGYANSGVWVIGEHNKTDASGPFLSYVQGGTTWQDNAGKVDAQIAATYYNFGGIKGKALDWCGGTNTGSGSCDSSSGANTGGHLKYNYDAINTAVEIGLKNPLQYFGVNQENPVIARMSAYGDVVHSFEAKKADTGWSTGVKLGSEKVAARGDWQMRNEFAILGRDAWPDTFPDSDRFLGKTNVKSYMTGLQYGLGKNVSLGLTYYNIVSIIGTRNPTRYIQADVLCKF